MADQWWRFDYDRQIWRRCTEAEARSEMDRLRGDAKVCKVDERLDVEKIGRMKNPCILCHSAADSAALFDSICDPRRGVDAWPHLTGIECRVNPYLMRPGEIAVIDLNSFNLIDQLPPYPPLP